MSKKKVHAARKPAAKKTKKKAVSKSGRAKPAAAGPLKATAVANMQWVHITLDKLIDTFPEEQALRQHVPTENHLLWTIGHLAVTYSWLVSLLEGKMFELPESYNALFGYGSKPGADPAAYPPIAEVKKSYTAAYTRFLAAANKLTARDLDKAPAADSFGFAKTRHEVLLRAAWHDGWHSGQLSALRRALGLPSVM
jgi:hypothetical protein